MPARELTRQEPPSSRRSASSGPKEPEEGDAAPLATRYRSLFTIGRGGMGSVEAALELGDAPVAGAPAHAQEADGGASTYERVVALKRLLPDAARDGRRVDMFLREARLATMLDHPNIVRAYDYGRRGGELYLAMEYVEGQPLSRLLRALAQAGERLPAGVVAYVVSEVCRGLHGAHELRDPATGQPLHLVHRDVSPQNVMLGHDGRVRLLDFGVAKIDTENVTRTGEVKGKTAYMSPEQAMGDKLDRRSDLFGVGAILFECLALRRMWGDGTDMDVLRKLALEEPPRLDVIDGLGPVPDALVALHARLVARDAKDRPEDADEVAEALGALVTEGAAEHLAKVLDAHFAEHARAQRERLSAALLEVAPEQVEELRASLPGPRGGDAKEEPSASEQARGDEVTRAPADEGPIARGRAWVGLAVLAAAVLGVVGWKAARGEEPATTSVSAATPSPTRSVESAPGAAASPGATSVSTPPSAETGGTSSVPSASPSSATLPRGAPSTGTPTRVASGSGAAVRGTNGTAGAPSGARSGGGKASATAASASSPRPAEIDEHPF